MDYDRQYKELFKFGRFISRNDMKPRNIYRINTYLTGEPIADFRYIFVIGILEDSIHCLKLNDIPPKHFISFLNKIRDKRIPITETTEIDTLLRKFSRNGSDLFERYIKPDSHIYSNKLQAYRIYKKKKITTVQPITFEENLLREWFNEKANETTRNIAIDEEIKEKDG